MRLHHDENLERTLVDMEITYKDLLKKVRDLHGKQNLDALTLLPRREHFELEDRDVFALMIIDLDHFKSINDRFGHPVGDEVLKQVGQHLGALALFHKQLSVCRLGGEEFALWITQPLCVSTIMDLAEHVRAAIETMEINVDNRMISVTASLGIVSSESESCGSDLRQLYKKADQALYEAKHSGRNTTKLAA